MTASMALLEAVERSEIDYMTDRMEAIRGRPGNPEGVEIASFGHAVCYYSRTMPWASFNSVKGLRSGSEGELPAIIDFYRSRDRKPQFELVPALTDSRLMRRLSELGFHQTGFHTSMYAEPILMPTNPTTPNETDNDIVVREIREDEFRSYAIVHCRGFGLPEDGIPHVEANNRVLHGREGWKFYLAWHKGGLAGAGVMHCGSRAASMTFAATLPEHRNHGVHAALLRARFEEASRRGCRLAVSQCAFLSQSHRNMEKNGMRIAYLKALWSEL